MSLRSEFFAALGFSRAPLFSLHRPTGPSRWLTQLSRSPAASRKPPYVSSSTPAACASTLAQKRKHRDPYALAQARARRAANLSRQQVLSAEREKALGDPVRGVTTPFVESFDTAGESDDVSGPQTAQSDHLNHFLSKSEFNEALQQSNLLTAPPTSPDAASGSADPAKQQQKTQQHRKEHAIAREALARITNLSNSSSKDRTRVNIQRCIETLGRHNTDGHLAPKPPSNIARDPDIPRIQKTPRAGPDTGSSEVQIAILTAKIRTLANFLETRGNKDKVNKRNLRMMVHKRQKLLQYLRRKERGGERWQHCIKTLGLTEGTWNQEISL